MYRSYLNRLKFYIPKRNRFTKFNCNNSERLGIILLSLIRKFGWKQYAFVFLFLCGLLGMGSGCLAQDSVPPLQDKFGQKCGMENCHGLDIKCGPNPLEMCTAMYALGDFCRQYVRCEIREGQCQLVEDPKFDACRSCVEKCQNPNDPIRGFTCEAECREKIG